MASGREGLRRPGRRRHALPVQRLNLASTRPLRILSAVGALFVACAFHPSEAASQIELAAGAFVDPQPSVGTNRVGPLVSVAGHLDRLGLPLFLEAAAARADFASLGQDYHHDYYLLQMGAEWFPTPDRVRVGFRLGVGAVGEYETVETRPPSPGGDNWTSAIVPGLVFERALKGGRRLVFGVSDFVLGPVNAIFDPDEYGVAHRIRIAAGIRL